MRNLAIWILSILMTTAVYAGDPVDMSQYFRTPIEHQRGGQCFAYASAALFEAACEQKTGKKVDISEASLYFNHLRKELSLHYGDLSVYRDVLGYDVNKNPIWKTYGFSRTNSQSKDFLAAGTIGNITGFDGGSFKSVLGEIVTGNVCAESEFPFNDTLETWISDTFRLLGGDEIKKHNDLIGERDSNPSTPITGEDFRILLDQYRNLAKMELDQYVSKNVQKDIGLKNGRNQSFGFKPNDPNLIACYDQEPILEYRETVLTPEDLIKQLEEKKPVICSVETRYLHKAGDDSLVDNSGGHVVIVMGHRTINGVEDFLIRDSNRDAPYWTSQGFKESLRDSIQFSIDENSSSPTWSTGSFPGCEQSATISFKK